MTAPYLRDFPFLLSVYNAVLLTSVLQDIHIKGAVTIEQLPVHATVGLTTFLTVPKHHQSPGQFDITTFSKPLLALNAVFPA